MYKIILTICSVLAGCFLLLAFEQNRRDGGMASFWPSQTKDARTQQTAASSSRDNPTQSRTQEEATPISGLVPLNTRARLFGWQGIGRIDIAGKGTCSGALIEPDIVLTAAHCVVNDNGDRYRADKLVFHAGYNSGDAAAVRRGKSVVYAPAYEQGEQPTAVSIMHDVAMILLEEPISPSVAQPFAVHSGELREVDLVVVSYGRGRNEYPSQQSDCKLTDLHLGLYQFDCDLTFGSSGAPVFSLVNGTPRILTLVSMGKNVRNGDDETVVFGMVLPRHIDQLKNALRNGEDLQLMAQSQPVVAIPQRIRMDKRTTTSALTARFKRP